MGQVGSRGFQQRHRICDCQLIRQSGTRCSAGEAQTPRLLHPPPGPILWFDPRPRAFFRPDRQIWQPPRAGAVKAGRHSGSKAPFSASRPRLGGPEHGGILHRSGSQGPPRQPEDRPRTARRPRAPPNKLFASSEVEAGSETVTTLQR